MKAVYHGRTGDCRLSSTVREQVCALLSSASSLSPILSPPLQPDSRSTLRQRRKNKTSQNPPRSCRTPTGDAKEARRLFRRLRWR